MLYFYTWSTTQKNNLQIWRVTFVPEKFYQKGSQQATPSCQSVFLLIDHSSVQFVVLLLEILQYS